MRWVAPDIKIKEIFVAYRQSRQLHKLAQEIVRITGADTTKVVLPDYAKTMEYPQFWRRT